KIPKTPHSSRRWSSSNGWVETIEGPGLFRAAGESGVRTLLDSLNEPVHLLPLVVVIARAFLRRRRICRRGLCRRRRRGGKAAQRFAGVDHLLDLPFGRTGRCRSLRHGRLGQER